MNLRYRGNHNMCLDCDNSDKMSQKCDPSSRSNRKSIITGAATVIFLLTSLFSSLHLLITKDFRRTSRNIGTQSLFEPINVKGIVRSTQQLAKTMKDDEPSALTTNCDWTCYVENYHDLKHLNDSKELVLAHWKDYGMAEGRDCTCKRLPTACSWECYLDNYEDLKHLGRTSEAAVSHYLSYGISEERDCTCPPIFRPKTTNDTAAICAIVTEEEMYLDEWLDFHLGIGFGHIYIYDNSNDFDLGHGWLERRPRLKDTVTVWHFPGDGKQLYAYRHCVKNYIRPGGHGWVSFLDVDEFIVLKKHTNIIDFLLEHCKQGSISLNWQLFGWDRRLQLSPEPVTKRFQGQALSQDDVHVKSITNVDALLPGQPNNPHYVELIDGHQQLDTNGNIVVNLWNNRAQPKDVALIYHYHTKSHKEYITKRSRGRSDLSGGGLSYAVSKNLVAAKRGENLLNTYTFDSSAWDNLVSSNSKYKIFDSKPLHSKQTSAPSSSLITCAIVTSQEAYVDEWVDYHLTLGVSRMYLFDTSVDFWMRQWGEESNKVAHVNVIHFPGDSYDLAFVAKTYAKCLSTYMMPNESFALVEVNDFLVPLHHDNLSPFRGDVRYSNNCATKIRRVIFGNDDKFVYDPLPVTKRFQRRVDDHEVPSLHPILMFTTVVLETDILDYLVSGNKNCSGESTEWVSYHYIRSRKECKRQRGDIDLCYRPGNVRDTSGWNQMQELIPWYSAYNGFL